MNDRPSLHDEIIDAVEDEEARLKDRIERLGYRLWARLVAVRGRLHRCAMFRRHRPS